MKRAIAIIMLSIFVVAVFPYVAGATFDSSQSVNRLRVVMTTTSDWSRLTVPSGETIMNHKGSVTGGSAGIVSVESNNIFIGQNPLGNPASVQYDILLTTDGFTDGQWKIEKGWGQSTHVEIYNINDINNPLLIASRDARSVGGGPELFVVNGQAASRWGPLSTGSMGPKKVFAVYYPWWTTLNNWQTNPRVGDAPTLPYDTQNQQDVARLLNEASDSGLNGFLASWQGKEHFSDIGFQRLLAAANQRQDFSVGVYMETRVANSSHSYDQPPDPVYLKQWITDLAGYGNDPANTSFLKVNGKPVIFVYWAKDLTPQQWSQLFSELRSQGIDAYYVADYTGADSSSYSDYLAVFDGMHIFNPSVYSNIPWVISTRANATKTYSLLDDPAAQRKMWVGTVVPGMNASRIGGNFVDRMQGQTYGSLWNSNLDNHPDWIMISTWNDYLENTYIESSEGFGNVYLDLTRSFAVQFKSEGVMQPPAISGLNSNPFLPGGLEAAWTTDRPTTAILEYGTQQGTYSASVRKISMVGNHRLSVSGLQPGTYYARAWSIDADGMMVVSPEFRVTVPEENIPQLSVDTGSTYWSDYASYTEGVLTVEFRVTNTGSVDVVNATVTHAQASGGVTAVGSLPVSMGNISAGAEGMVSIRWRVPASIDIFQANLWARAVTAIGTTVYYPDAPRDDA